MKAILTFTALATFGALLLAPIDASAAGKRGAANHPRAAARPVVRNNINVRIRFGARPEIVVIDLGNGGEV